MSKAEEARKQATEQLQKMAHERHITRVDTRTGHASITKFADISAEEIEWLWPGRIAIGKQTGYVGDPGVGKTQASLDLAARCSTGLPFPDGTRVAEPCDTLILTSEDDPGDTIRPRLDALGADLERIHYFRCKVKGDKSDAPSLLDLDVIKDAADQIRAKGGRLRLLIVDPLEGYLGGVDSYKNTEVRGVLAPLVALAAAERFAVLGIQHLNKGNGNASYRVGGSIAFTALARSVWIFAKDPNNEGRRVFLCLKNNLGVDNAGLEYTIEQADNGAPHIVWKGRVDDDIRDVLSDKRTTRDDDDDRHAPEQERVLTILKERYPSAIRLKDVCDAVGKGKQAVSNILRKLQEQGHARQSTALYGYWELTPPSPTNISSVSSESSVSSVSSESSVSTSLTSLTSLSRGVDGSESSPETPPEATFEDFTLSGDEPALDPRLDPNSDEYHPDPAEILAELNRATKEKNKQEPAKDADEAKQPALDLF